MSWWGRAISLRNLGRCGSLARATEIYFLVENFYVHELEAQTEQNRNKIHNGTSKGTRRLSWAW